MSEAEDKYYEEIEEGFTQISRSIANDYITELKQQIAQLQESQKQKSIIKLCERLDKAEQQNKELLEFVKEMREIGKLNPERLPEYTDIIYHHANDLIIRITGGER